MKSLFIVLLLLPNAIVRGQFFEDNFIYGNFALSPGGNYTVLNTSVSYVHKRYTLEFGYSHFYREPHSIPDDFEPLFDLYPLPPSEDSYYDQLRSYEFLVGRQVNTGVKWIRLNLKAGLISSRITEVANWTKETQFTTLGSYEQYNYDLEHHYGLGLVLKPAVEFPFSRFAGLSVSPYLVLNDRTSAYGAQLSISLGYLRGK